MSTSQPPPSNPAPPPNVDDLLAENAALRRHNALLNAVVANSPTVIFAKDRAGRYILCNPRFEQSFGAAPGSLVGKVDRDIIGPKAAQQVGEHDRQVCESGQVLMVEEIIPQIDGEHTYISLKFPLRNASDEVYGIAGIATDITDRKREEQERAALQQKIIDVQRSALSELSTPIIPLAAGVIVMPLIGAVDSERAQQILQALLEGLGSSRAHTAILDITGVRSVDTHVAGGLLQAARAARLLGAKVIITGIRPEVAQALVQLGADLSGIETVGTLHGGVALAMTRARED